VRVEGANKVGLLAAISAAIADTQTNIEHVTLEQRDGDISVITLEVEVHDRDHLARILKRIRRMPDVLHVARHILKSEARRVRLRTPTQTTRKPDA
jgi:(p)ppGpp synthase/HD superfamily hydrolase